MSTYRRMRTSYQLDKSWCNNCDHIVRLPNSGSRNLRGTSLLRAMMGANIFRIQSSSGESAHMFTIHVESPLNWALEKKNRPWSPICHVNFQSFRALIWNRGNWTIWQASSLPVSKALILNFPEIIGFYLELSKFLCCPRDCVQGRKWQEELVSR